MIPKALCRAGYRFFGKYTFKYRQYFKDVLENMRKARMPYTLDEYLAGIAFTSVLAFFTLFIISFVFNTSFFSDIVLSFLSSFFFALSLSALILVFLLNYPKMVADSRREEIDARLPFAVTHMSTLAGTGIPVVSIFRALTHFKDYGEIAKESAFIVRDVELFGKDILTAMADGARYSPSRKWAELLWGMISTLRSGGNLRAFLSDKAKELVENVEREEKKAVENVGILMDIYMVLFVLAPIIGVIMVALMGLLGGSVFGMPPKTLLILFVYIILPLLGMAFLYLAEKGKPREVL